MIVISMLQLWYQGNGLPMNAYPPEKHVSTGLYFYFSHPIYVGFCICCFAVSAIVQSAAGFYLISPTMVLLCWALVKGYEEPELKHRFELKDETKDHPVSWSEKLKIIFPFFVLWLIGYELLVFIGYDVSFINTVLPWEETLPIVEWFEIPYILTYPIVFITPWLVKTKEQLSRFQRVTFWTIVFGLFIQWLVPAYAQPRSFVPQTWLGDLILWERSSDSPAAAFPSFHVLWILICVFTLANLYPRLKIIWFLIAVLISISCMAVGAHSLLDVIAAMILFAAIIGAQSILKFFQQVSEQIANSWKSWNVGGLRIINHAVYSGLAAFVGTLIVGQFLRNEWHIVIIIFGSLLGGMFWGQWIEGSKKMLRPFGYFGAIIGGLLTTAFVCFVFDYSFVILVAAVALAAPWTQALGRLRCLVQGCCHGGETHNSLFGIRYTNQHSRVCAISGMKGKLLHNTQGYSIVFNIATGLILLRLWYAGSSPSIIAGLYFILAGASRFVEEHYRGEIQTRNVKGLHIYQWLAIGSILTGMVLTTVKSSEALLLEWNFSPTMLLACCITGFLWAFGMSMDFPKSNVRFSRLTG